MSEKHTLVENANNEKWKANNHNSRKCYISIRMDFSIISEHDGDIGESPPDSESYQYQNDKNDGKYGFLEGFYRVFHTVELFNSLGHDFETSDRCPDNHDEFWFEEMEYIEDKHHDASESDEDSLSETRIHGRHGDISAVVDFLQEKYKYRENTRAREKK